MGLRFQYWILTGLAGGVLLLVVLNIALFVGNSQRQQEINARQVLIQESPQREAVFHEIAKSIAELAMNRGDTQLKSLLVGQGITVNASQPAQASTTTATGSGKPSPAGTSETNSNKR